MLPQLYKEYFMEIQTSEYDRSNVQRLLTALNHREPDRVPHLELWVTSQGVYEHILERKLSYKIGDAAEGGQSITPEDDVEFARRLGQDAVLCNCNWRPNNVFELATDGTRHYVNGSIKSIADLENLEPPPAIDDQLRHLERYLKAAQGTGVGIIPNLTSFFDSAMLAIGVTDSFYMFYDNRPLLDKLMDILLEQQTKVMQAVCKNFGQDIALVMINDDIGYNSGLMIKESMFMGIFPHRMKQLIAPAKDIGKLVLMHTDGKLDCILPILYDVGINVNHPIEPESNDLAEVKKKWAGKMSLIGNVHTPLLAFGKKDQIEEKVREYCMTVAPGGGYVLGSSTSIMDGIPPENFETMVRAVHKYGRYGSLGQAV
jgi:uroporphyrinogen-III decarboxylase